MFNKEKFINKVKGNLLDFYKVKEELGSGSYGKVYQVTNKVTHEVRAVKQLPKNKIRDYEKFKLEMNIMAKTDHPNIIKLYEVFEDNRYVYLVMELCKGGELFDRIINKLKAKTIFTEKEAAKIFKQIISAVAYCHKEGICHRDLKPENLLLVTSDEDSPLKVIDFGLSNIFKDPKTKQNLKMNTKVGTAYYISPEVLAGNYDEKCDIWSAGVILYILLCGDPPFDGTDSEIYKKIKEKKLHFSNPTWKNISEDAINLIKWMLSDPDKRPTAEDVYSHKWVAQLAPNSKEAFLKLDINSLKTFSNTNRLKKAVLTFVASRLKEDDLSHLKEIFVYLDKNGDGHLTLDELKEGIAQLNKGKIQNIEELFKNMDTDGSGSINYTGDFL